MPPRRADRIKLAGLFAISSPWAPSSLSAAATGRGAPTIAIEHDETERLHATTRRARPAARHALRPETKASTLRATTSASNPSKPALALDSAQCWPCPRRTSAWQARQILRRLAPSSTCCKRAAHERLRQRAAGPIRGHAFVDFKNSNAVLVGRHVSKRLFSKMFCCFRPSTYHGRMTGHAYEPQVRLEFGFVYSRRRLYPRLFCYCRLDLTSLFARPFCSQTFLPSRHLTMPRVSLCLHSLPHGLIA